MNKYWPNILVKDHLAKLLAGENITVVHENVRWPYFDVGKRILGLPLWDGLDHDSYDLLIGHETAHAIFTPQEWYAAISSGPGGAVDCDLKNCINIVEDARIERFILKQYPGLRGNFRRGYRKLCDTIFKGVEKKASTLGLGDRVNIHFKLNVSGDMNVRVPFDAAEQNLVDRIAVVKTFKGVVELAKELLAMDVANQRITSHDDLFGDGDMEVEIEIDEELLPENWRDNMKKGKSGKEGNVTIKVRTKDKGEEDKESKGKSKSKSKSKESGEGSEDEGEGSGSGKGEETDEDAEGEGSGSGEGDGESTDGDAEGSDGGAEDGEGEEGGEPSGENQEHGRRGGHNKGLTKIKIRIRKGDDTGVGKTERLFQDFAEDKNQYGSTKTVSYATIGEVDWDKIIIPCKKMLKNSNTVKRDRSYIEWRQLQKSLVDHMVAQFNRKKAAKAYENRNVAKTGILNLTKLHTVRYSDDVFKTATRLPQGKKHCLMMFIDFSSSMSGTIGQTVKQLLCLTAFCDMVAIPYRIYGFTTKDAASNMGKAPDGFFKKVDPRFETVGPNDNTTIFELFRESMSKHEKAKMSDMLWSNYCLGVRTRSWPVRMSGTPMTDAMFLAVNTLPDFMRVTASQVAHVVFLSDGDDNQSRKLYGFDQLPNQVIVQHGGKQYQFGPPTGEVRFFKEVLRDTCRAEIVNFFICNYIQEPSLNEHDKKGWSREYLINLGAMEPQPLPNPQGRTSGEFFRAYNETLRRNEKMRFILTNFIEAISKNL